jgi:hypothetical protein
LQVDDDDTAEEIKHARRMIDKAFLSYQLCIDGYELRIVCCIVNFLQVDDDATAEEIKRAYRSMAKECHPDYLGDKGHNICILLNEAYEVRPCADTLHCLYIFAGAPVC